MKLGQINWTAGATAAIFDRMSARPIPDYTLGDLILRAEKEGEQLAPLAERLASRHPIKADPIIPLFPREVWACGATYEASAASRDAGIGASSDFCSLAFHAERPEILLKGTGRVCVGPGEAIGIRPDSSFTSPAPELALVLGARGRILGYMLGNDVSARDLEFENPLYRPQAKTYTGCCALGPYMVTADEIADPYAIELTCTIHRHSHPIFTVQVSTAALGRKFESLVEYLIRANPVPPGSVLLTGSGISISREAALAEGDSVTISAPQLGELTNQAVIVSQASATRVA